MNFLAHVHLSHGIAPLITGNLIADAYKGNKHQLLEREIQQGVLLHRKIDYLTDTLEAVLIMKRALSPYFGRYAGVALDVYFDHILSVKWEELTKTKLNEAITVIHANLEKHLPFVNDESRVFLQRLIKYNWLGSYGDKDDLHRIFSQMAQRFGLNVLKNSKLPLEKHYLEIEATFDQLYPLLIVESKRYILDVGL